MNYNWGINNLINDKKNLKEMYKKETNLVKKYELLRYIDDLNTLIKMKKLKIENIALNNSFITHYKPYLWNERYYNLINYYYETSLKKFKQIKLTTTDLENAIKDYLNDANLEYYSLDACFEIAREVYGDTNNSIYKYFMQIYKNRHEIVKERNNLYDENVFVGSCLYIAGVDKPYIEIHNMAGLEKVNTVIHEIAHSIMRLKYPNRAFDENDRFTEEIESTFFELVFQNGIGQLINQLDSSFQTAETTFSTYIASQEVNMHQKIMQEIKNNKIEINNEFYKKLKTKYKITKNQANYYINQEISDFGQYVIGHMVALELYKIYKQDKKEALKILDKIIKNNTKDTLVNLSEYFNIKESLNNNLTEEYKKINNQFVKKIERG